MIALLDYEAGNLASVANALTRLGADFRVTHDRAVLDAADGVIFPGVGHAASAMASLRGRGLDTWLKSTAKPVFGICLGMQLLFESSEEGGGTPGLGIISGRLKAFDPTAGKVPHMGWNRVRATEPGRTEAPYYYFVHSFQAPVVPETTGICTYAGVDFTAEVQKGRFSGVQYHPEKSGDAGEAVIRRFLESVRGGRA